MDRPALDGVLVVSLEQAVAAPFCTSRLAEMGARIIKIEREGGDFARQYDAVVHGESAYFVWLNRGKESVVLDIKDAADAALAHRMVARADIFIQNLAPGAAARAGFGSEALRRRHPRLITCDVSGYGAEGPYAEMKAYDLLVQAESGLCAVTGRPEGPGRVGVSVCDIACGMNAAMAILEALIARSRTGVGRAIATSLFAGMAEWMTVPLLHFEYGGLPPARLGLNHPSIAPYGAYATQGGPPILISIQNEREFARFSAEVLNQFELPRDARFASGVARLANREALDEIINRAFMALARDALIARLRAAGIAFGEVNEVADLAVHPALGRIDAATPSGPVRLVAPPARVAGHTPVCGPVPAIGQHTEAIRREFAA